MTTNEIIENEKNIYESIVEKLESGWYKQYEFKSVGTILSFIYAYTSLNIAEKVIVHPNKVELHGRDFAYYGWDDKKKIPIFSFVLDYDFRENYIFNQNIYLKYRGEE